MIFDVFYRPRGQIDPGLWVLHGLKQVTEEKFLKKHVFMKEVFYFTTKHLHTQYRSSSGQNRWLFMPAGPEGIIQFSVVLAGKNLSLIKDYCSNFHDFLKMI